MQTATSETESKSLDLSICVHHYTLRAPCPKGQGIPTDALQRISMTARSSSNCLQAVSHAFHWLSWSNYGTRGWPNDSGRLQTGLFGVALSFKLQKKGDPVRPPPEALRD